MYNFLRKNQNLVMITIVAVLLMGLGFAILNTNLSIAGVANVSKNTWDVHWENVQVITGSVTGEQVITAPTISNQTTVNFRVRLKEPGEYYEFTVDAKNDGNLDAMIGNINYNVNGNPNGTLPDYLKVSLTCEGAPITANQALNVNTKRTYTVRVEFRDDISINKLPSSAQSISFGVEVPYVQADKNVIPFDVLYTVSDTNTPVGSIIPNTVTTYDNYQAAVNAFGHPFFHKLTVVNNQISATYVGFIMNGNVYYIRGGDGGASYKSNKTVLSNLFGSENCQNTGNDEYYICFDQTSELTAIACKSGCTDVHDRSHICETSEDGTTICTSCQGYCLYIA